MKTKTKVKAGTDTEEGYWKVLNYLRDYYQK